MKFVLSLLISILCYGEYLPRINVVIDYDQQTKVILGNSTENYISDLTLAAKLVYRNELGIDLNIIKIRPINITPNNINGNLELYKNYINNNPVSGVQIYHLIQGGNLGLNGLGLSYQDGACTAKLGISTSKISSFAFTAQTIVHEIAHSIGAKHEDSSKNIMNSSNEFQSFNFTNSTKTEIKNFILKSCLAKSRIAYPSLVWNKNGSLKKIVAVPRNSKVQVIVGTTANFKKALSSRINKRNSFLIKVTNKRNSYYITNKVLSTDLINNLSLLKE